LKEKAQNSSSFFFLKHSFYKLNAKKRFYTSYSHSFSWQLYLSFSNQHVNILKLIKRIVNESFGSKLTRFNNQMNIFTLIFYLYRFWPRIKIEKKILQDDSRF